MDTLFSNHTPDAIPAYKLPLSDDDLIMLGRLMAYWAQVDMFVDELIEMLFSIDYQKRVVLVGDKMVGAKLSILRKGISLCDSPELARAVTTFADLATAVQAKRNHAAHGVWAWYIQPGMDQPELSARKAKDLSDRLRPAELHDLVSHTAAATRAGMDAAQIARGSETGRYRVRLFYGKEDMGDEWHPPQK